MPRPAGQTAPRLRHVSTAEQSLDLQRDALERAGCERIIVDTLSGVASVRPGLEKVREQLRRDDVLVVWRLDRLGRSLKDLIAWATWLDEQGVALVSLHETIDTASPTGTPHLPHVRRPGGVRAQPHPRAYPSRAGRHSGPRPPRRTTPRRSTPTSAPWRSGSTRSVSSPCIASAR